MWFRRRQSSVAWKDNQPTKIIVDCFNGGLLKPSESVIDIGCGFGRNANWLAAQGLLVTAIDTDNKALTVARHLADRLSAKPIFLLGDFLMLPLAKDSFNVALDLGCSHLLSWVDQGKFANKLAGIVKPGGHLVYFGFTKQHPDYRNKPDSPMFRDLSDIKRLYGDNFSILSCQEERWQPKPEEKTSYNEHVGLNIVMRRK